MPPTLLGPCCIPGPNDTATTPNHCLPGEAGVAACKQACTACPGTPGSDCSRCDQVSSVQPGRYKKAPQFPAPCPNCEGVDWNGYSVQDVVRIPENLKPGKVGRGSGGLRLYDLPACLPVCLPVCLFFSCSCVRL